jgi:hypothetical protein
MPDFTIYKAYGLFHPLNFPEFLINLLLTTFNPPSRSATADEKLWFNSPGLAPEKRVQGESYQELRDTYIYNK